MQIVYNDGGRLSCSFIEIHEDALYCDEMYVVALDEICYITEDGEEIEEELDL